MAIARMKIWQIYTVAGLVCAAATAIAWFALAAPTLEQLSGRRGRESELTQSRHKATELAHDLAEARKEMKVLSTQIASNAIELQPASQVNQRLAALTTLATANGLSLNELRPGAPTETNRYQMLPIHLTGAGDYPSCAAFLHGLHDSYTDVGLSSLEALNSDSSGETSRLNFQIELVWYTKK
jgi:Tfp pilus assembly protein PilO